MSGANADPYSRFMHEETLTVIRNTSERTEQNLGDILADILAALDLRVRGPYQFSPGDDTSMRIERTLAAIHNSSKRTEQNFADILAALDLLVRELHQSSPGGATRTSIELEGKTRNIDGEVAVDNEVHTSHDASQNAEVSQKSLEITTLPTSTEQSFDSAATASLFTKAREGEEDDAPMTEHLLKTGADVEHIDVESGFTPLLVAAKNKRIEVCRKLLENSYVRANIHAKDKEGRNVLHIALFSSKNVDLVKLLIDYGA